MKIPLTTLFLALSLLSLCNVASAVPIISDTFTDTNGKTLGPDASSQTTNEHNPEVNQTLNPYTYDNTFNHNPITVEGDKASIPAGPGGVAAIDITSSASLTYSKPTTLTISAELEPNNITTSNSFDKEGLGFYSAPQPGQVFEAFLGLALSADGTVSLIGFDTADFSTTVDDPVAYTLGTFNPTAFHKLTYTIDTATGGISGATLTDALGTQDYTFSTTLFETTMASDPTTYAGFYARSDTGGTTQNPATAYLDNFTLTAPNYPIPEPSTVALMVAGLAGLAFVARNRRGRFAFRG